MRCKQWIFDMDGTLTDSMTTVWRQAPIAMLEHFGCQARPGLRKTLLSMTIPQAAEYLHQEYGLPMDEVGYTRLLRQEVNHLYQTVELKPGVREMLARLAQQGARMCICSNTWEAQCREVLSRLGVESYFEFFITAQGEQSKRRPEVFLEAMQRLGGTDPASCAVCEDAVYAARTAAGAGFYVVGIADEDSRADEPELRSLSRQFLPDWTALDWDQV